MSVQIYENALDQARNDLAWITREFEKLRIRKELLESFEGALNALIANLNSTGEPAPSADHSGSEEAHAQHQG
jgi:hypothetical protein